ncbi:helix-turn-helix transcriptional regulator [Nakamurella sp. A5-74]|uniref:Helix-turn-helix transcriptional regulator n=1 Tax=Nakamurella sp. A5-74 TaxID=3158264 RepID=A0AAU8DTJ0_9ACTN
MADGPPTTQHADRFDAALLDQLRAARRCRGWTQRDLAGNTNGLVSKSALAGYELGQRTLRMPVAWILAQALGEKLSALISRAEVSIRAQEPVVRLHVRRVLNSTDQKIAVVRTWLHTRYPRDVAAAIRLSLTEQAVQALATRMQITVGECRERLQPYIRGDSPPSAEGTVRNSA